MTKTPKTSLFFIFDHILDYDNFPFYKFQIVVPIMAYLKEKFANILGPLKRNSGGTAQKIQKRRKSSLVLECPCPTNTANKKAIFFEKEMVNKFTFDIR